MCIMQCSGLLRLNYNFTVTLLACATLYNYYTESKDIHTSAAYTIILTCHYTRWKTIVMLFTDTLFLCLTIFSPTFISL